MSTATCPVPAPILPTTPHRLDAAGLEHYQRHGWVVKRSLIASDLIARIGVEIDGLHERMAEREPAGVGLSWEENLPAGAPPRIRQLMNSELVSPLLDQVSRSDEVLDVLEQLIGPDLYLYHSKLMMKPARDGSFTPWHQDFQYWQYQSRLPTQVNCMLYIDASDVANGALRFVPGSHRQGVLPHVTLPTKSFQIGLPGDLDAYPEAVPVAMRPGDAVFFGALVIHGSGPNASGRHRRANTFAYDTRGNQLKGALDDRLHRRGRR